MKRFLVERFTPDMVEEEVAYRLGDKATPELVNLLCYHICVKMKYSRTTMIDRFVCLPSMIDTIDTDTRRIFNESLFCFDAHDCQKDARI